MNEKFFDKKISLPIVATLCCALWGSAPSCIKLGYELFQITSSDTMNIMLFAGCRFFLSGFLVVLGYSIICGKPVIPEKMSWKAILCLAMAQTAVQYIFYYVGAANASGVKTSILSGSGAFFSVIVASLIFRQEKLTVNKLLGCLAGLIGIVMVTLQGSTEALTGEMSLLGEGCILLSTISSAFSSVLIRIFSQKHNAVILSGYQFMTGGLIMILVALACGGTLPQITASGLLLLLYLAGVSAVAYTLWSLLLQHNPVSKVTIYNFLIPIFGVILSTILLGEGSILSATTVISLVFVCVGILLVNYKKTNK